MLQVHICNLIVLAAVQNPLLNGCVHLALTHGGSHTTHVFHHCNHGRRFHNTYLHAVQVFRRLNGFAGIHIPGSSGVGRHDLKALFLGGLKQRIQDAGGKYFLLVFLGIKYIRKSQD